MKFRLSSNFLKIRFRHMSKAGSRRACTAWTRHKSGSDAANLSWQTVANAMKMHNELSLRVRVRSFLFLCFLLVLKENYTILKPWQILVQTWTTNRFVIIQKKKKKILIKKKAPTTVQICKLENIEHKSMK